MTERRDLIDIYTDILRAIDKGKKRTHIVYEANLNFSRLKQYMTSLFKEGLVKIKSSSPSAWAVTDQGYDFLKKYEELRKMMARPEAIEHGIP